MKHPDQSILDPKTRAVFIRFRPAMLRLTPAQIRHLSQIAGMDEHLLTLLDADQHVQIAVRENFLSFARHFEVEDNAVVCLGSKLASLLGSPRQKRSRPDGLFDIELSFPAVGRHASAREKFSRLLDLLQSKVKSPETAECVAEPLLSYLPSTVSKASVSQLIGIRRGLRDTIEMLDSEKWGEWRNVTNNPAAALAKHREQGRVFAVREGRIFLYPRFQFDAHGAPLPAIAQILALVPEDARGWPLLSWFDARNNSLQGRKPREVLASHPTAVVEAAREFYEEQ